MKYKGKSVLYQASVPILNVEYEDKTAEGSCGPYYCDWQNSEYPLHCPLGQGFRAVAEAVQDARRDNRRSPFHRRRRLHRGGCLD